MTTFEAPTKTIAIVGGGVSGALTAFHLAQQGARARVILIDQRSDLGLGLAYSTPSLRHLLNVPAGKISALPDQPDHFLDWLRANHDSEATEMTYAPRAVFGRYVQSLLRGEQRFEQERAMVVDVRLYGRGAVLTFGDGREIYADHVVLATGNFDPAPLPGVTSDAVDSGRYHHNAWSATAYEALPIEASVALIGTGLTGVDVVLRLRELGHRGRIIAVSRHGIFPNRHVECNTLGFSAIPEDTPPTCVACLHAIRAVIRAGAEWRAAIDSLRASTNELWLRLPLKEQQRFRRHLQRRWDVLRHRMAPPIADIIETELHAGTLEIREGYLKSVDVAAAGARVVIDAHDQNQTFYVDRVINCTGPGMNYRRVPSALLQNLFARELVAAGPLGTGFHCSGDGALINPKGEVSEILFNLGPGRLGDLLESIAVPEIRGQALALAVTLANRLKQESGDSVETYRELAEKRATV